MLRFHARAPLRCLTLVAGPLFVRLAWLTSAFEDCEPFSPFGQPAHCRLALRLP